MIPPGAALLNATITWSAGTYTTSQHGAPRVDFSGAGITQPCYVEAGTSPGTRADGTRESGRPAGTKKWAVYTTGAAPPVAVNASGTWNGITLQVLAPPNDLSNGSGVLWRTDCFQVD